MLAVLYLVIVMPKKQISIERDETLNSSRFVSSVCVSEVGEEERLSEVLISDSSSESSLTTR